MFEKLRKLFVLDFNLARLENGVIVQLASYPFVAEEARTIEDAIEKIYERNTNLEFRFGKLRIRRYTILDSAGNGARHIHIKYG